MSDRRSRHNWEHIESNIEAGHPIVKTAYLLRRPSWMVLVFRDHWCFLKMTGSFQGDLNQDPVNNWAPGRNIRTSRLIRHNCFWQWAQSLVRAFPELLLQWRNRERNPSLISHNPMARQKDSCKLSIKDWRNLQMKEISMIFCASYRSTPSYNLGLKTPHELTAGRKIKIVLDLLKPQTRSLTNRNAVMGWRPSFCKALYK